tara:strand:+ start:361 stop:516 length:156 start_codon:yes stop_codon:yes gene_type:complete
MSWTYTLTQNRNDEGELIPVWTVTQWNTNNTNQTWQTTITTAVKEVAYPDD